tara:strand:- start:211 stop:2100 length:1890 start_codon:yes stop_codon:yes gene_type:complete
MATNLNVTELDFDQIKENIKNFMKSQSQFNDYDFEGSGLNVLMDILAYNTHYNAMLAHFALNESFLDSAQIRGNVVSRASLLGYVPRSILAPRATVKLVVDVSNYDGVLPASLVIERGTKFNTLVDGVSYTFSTLESYTAVRTETTTAIPNVEVGTKQFIFPEVQLGQGVFRFLSYRVDNDIENQKFQISDTNADTSSLRVRIQNNQESNSYDSYSIFTTLQEVNSGSQVYHLQENSSGYYQIFFGDGIIGKKPVNDNIVTIDYLVTDGQAANGANAFTLTTDFPVLEGNGLTHTTTTTTAATGGTNPETTESIRFNAPITFQAQDRAVTAQDYAAIIQRNFANIESISTWGGEDQIVPDYGKAYVSIKPLIGNTLSDAEKAQIKDILTNKNIVSIRPELVDPEFTNLELDVIFKYNPALTSRSESALESLVTDTILNYNFNQLNKFDGVFRHSELLSLVDNCDPAITSSTIRPFMFKTITPSTVQANNAFTLSFTNSFFIKKGKEYSISSTPFLINGVEHFFGDREILDSDNRVIHVYKIENSVDVVVVPDAGLIDVNNGIITLNNFATDDTTDIRVTIVPNSLDLAPKRNQIINIEASRIIASGSIDQIAYSGPSGTIDYSTTDRMR